jgi:hypothetical protein
MIPMDRKLFDFLASVDTVNPLTCRSLTTPEVRTFPPTHASKTAWGGEIVERRHAVEFRAPVRGVVRPA